jgi:phage recombination protein Bet
MTTAIAHADKARTSILAKMADRFSVEPTRLLDALKATAFKTQGGVTNEQMIALLIVADQYKLNPFTREVFAFPDKGGIVPVVSVDGWARIINEHPQFDGVSFSYDDSTGAMTCVIYRKDRAHPIQVTEYMAECKRNTQPWQSHPRRMLRHKALIQCARVAFGFAGIYDEDEAHRIVHGGIADEVKPAGGSLAAVRAVISGKTQAAEVVDYADTNAEPDVDTVSVAHDEAGSDPGDAAGDEA